jgi:lipoprotein-anchoring transpeptidase ErfK/SrfK
MPELSRRKFITGTAGAFGALALAGCVSTGEHAGSEALGFFETDLGPKSPAEYARIYAPITTDKFPIPAIPYQEIDPRFLRQTVRYDTDQKPGTIIVVPAQHFLYHVMAKGKATRYGVGVGREGFAWSGTAKIQAKREWPDWYPPADMFKRQPEIKKVMEKLPSGLGMKGGPRNPLGCRAMYLYEDGKDTLYRIHGTTEPLSIGKSMSSGCIRMLDQDALDLYSNTPLGTKVIVEGNSVA